MWLFFYFCGKEEIQKGIYELQERSHSKDRQQEAEHRLENKCVLRHISNMKIQSWALLKSKNRLTIEFQNSM